MFSAFVSSTALSSSAAPTFGSLSSSSFINTQTPPHVQPLKPIRHHSRIQCAAESQNTQIKDETTQVSDSFSTNVMHTYARYPIAISHGQGSCLFDLNGKRYIDCVAGIATCTLGHAHPAIIEAVTRQISRTAHVSNLYYIPEQATLAEWLVKNSPCDKVFFCNSGAEANEAAIKLTRKHWYLSKDKSDEGPEKPIILTAHQSFHGRTLATLTATGQPKYRKNWGPLPEGFDYVEYNNVQHLTELCDKYGDALAGILLETIQGEGGIRPGTKEFLLTARRLCDEHGALLIFDEVQVGMGRTGSTWAFEQIDVVPDVFTLAKGLGGGVPIGAMLCKAHCNVFQPGDHASTFGGNPLATAAGAAVARELIDGGVLQNAKDRGAQLESGLLAIKDRYAGVITEIRGRGLIRGVQLTEGLKAADVVQKAIDRGLLLVPAGLSVVRFVPPLVITEADVVDVLAIFEVAIKAVA